MRNNLYQKYRFWVENILKVIGEQGLPEAFTLFEKFLIELDESESLDRIKDELASFKDRYRRATKAYYDNIVSYDEHERSITNIRMGVLDLRHKINPLIELLNQIPEKRPSIPPISLNTLDSNWILEKSITFSANPQLIINNFEQFIQDWESLALIETSITYDYDYLGNEKEIVHEKRICWKTGVLLEDEIYGEAQDTNGAYIVRALVLLNEVDNCIIIKVKGEGATQIMLTRIINWWLALFQGF